jgi:hypothetical protein
MLSTDGFFVLRKRRGWLLMSISPEAGLRTAIGPHAGLRTAISPHAGMSSICTCQMPSSK